MDNTELIRGHVDTIILRILEEQDRYGYEILDLISKMSDGRYAVKQATLYSCLKRLEKQGFISSYFGEETNGGRRRYYKLDEKGKNTLLQDQREWEFSRTLLDRLLSDKPVDLKTVEAPFNAEELRPLTKRIKAYDIPDPADRRVYTLQTAPIIIPITVETKTVQTEQKPIPQPAPTAIAQPAPPVPNFFGAILGPVQALPSASNPVSASIAPISAATEGKEAKSDQTSPKSDPPFAVSADKNREDELRMSASRLLGLGEFAPPPARVVEQMIAKPAASSAATEPKQEAKPDYFKKPASEMRPAYHSGSSYKDTLASLFGKRAALVPEAAAAAALQEAVKPEELPARRQYYDLKQELAAEGYKLKSYSRATASDQYYMNYVYSNRLLRDTSFLIYLTIVIELILIFIARKVFTYQMNTLIPMGAAALAIPLGGALVWIISPTKRKKARFALNQALVNSAIAYILIVALTTIVYLVSPSIDIGFHDPRMYVPYILAANLPLFVLIYNFLYQSKHYHLK